MNEVSLDAVFSPYAPITDQSFCYGRKRDIKLIKESIASKGKHIILFGERGSGKTSLANISFQNLKGIYSVSIVCSQSIKSSELLWKSVLEKILFSIEHEPQFSKLKKHEKTLQTLLEKKQFHLNHLTHFFNQIKEPILISMDEVDLLSKSKETLLSLAEMIKAFSDQVPNVTIMLIGIANSANELIAKHVSLERCLVEIKLERMSREELQDIIDGGLMKLRLNMMDDVKNSIIQFSEGLPFYVHLLAKETLEHGLERRYKTVVKSNFQHALKKILNDRNHSLEYKYQKATTYSKNGFYENILDACISYYDQLEKDREDVLQPIPFHVKDILPFLIKKMGKCNERTVQNYLNRICLPLKGEILSKIQASAGTRFTFANPLIKMYIKTHVRGMV